MLFYITNRTSQVDAFLCSFFWLSFVHCRRLKYLMWWEANGQPRSVTSCHATKLLPESFRRGCSPGFYVEVWHRATNTRFDQSMVFTKPVRHRNTHTYTHTEVTVPGMAEQSALPSYLLYWKKRRVRLGKYDRKWSMRVHWFHPCAEPLISAPLVCFTNAPSTSIYYIIETDYR